MLITLVMDFLAFKPEFSRRLSRIFFSASSRLSRNFRGRLAGLAQIAAAGRLSRRLRGLAHIDTLFRSPCSLNFPNLCDNIVKILVSEIRKCHQLQVPLTPDQMLCPWTPLGHLPPKPHYIIWPPLS